ncbi:4-oxalocrotonate tautomerase family enzyme [Roseiarcus fermentans]|uniref:4-oxalocrotonate tautomerase family enzyme n=1 Tax=Roseiarcus fermentans TaxID=1473586 RepID=A0A366FH50_9HYPH|nr:tautomerase family protein [Roseiarcus fermentans]RBP13988.1 4-oxalocrotonate tautomerase family enzyme [Roseiarcus fermentans]
MPIAHINLLKGHSRAALRRVIVDVSEAMSTILEAPKDRLFVWITEHDHHLWGLAGAPADEALAHGTLAQLEVPFVQMVLMDGRPKEQFQAMIAAVTESVAAATGCDASKIRVHIARGDPEGWGIGGVPASVLRAAEIADRARRQ